MNADRINAIIDSNEQYAYACLEQSNVNFARMTVKIRLARRSAWNDLGSILISCQLGAMDGDIRQLTQPYAVRHGFQAATYEAANLEQLTAATKVMRKIDNYLRATTDKLGTHASFSEYCQRILVGSGTKIMIAEPGNWASGGYMKDKQLMAVDAHSAMKLREMEAALIERFARKAA